VIRRRYSALCYDDAIEIRELCKAHPQSRVALLFDVGASTISHVVTGKYWVKTDEQLASMPNRPSAELTESQVREIRHLKRSSRELAEMFGVRPRTIRSITSGQSWKDLL
jgi:hypothetical protein